jgi:hypothetical protein
MNKVDDNYFVFVVKCKIVLRQLLWSNEWTIDVMAGHAVAQYSISKR